MADQTDEKAKAAEQADLFGELQETDVKVADDKAAENCNTRGDETGGNEAGLLEHVRDSNNSGRPPTTAIQVAGYA